MRTYFLFDAGESISIWPADSNACRLINEYRRYLIDRFIIAFPSKCQLHDCGVHVVVRALRPTAVDDHRGLLVLFVGGGFLHVWVNGHSEKGHAHATGELRWKAA